MTVALHVADAGSIADPDVWCILMLTVSAAETNPVQIKLASIVDGAPSITVSPTSAPVTVMVRTSMLFEEMEGKSSVAVSDITPRFVLAPAAVLAPVPPSVTARSVARVRPCCMVMLPYRSQLIAVTSFIPLAEAISFPVLLFCSNLVLNCDVDLS